MIYVRSIPLALIGLSLSLQGIQSRTLNVRFTNRRMATANLASNQDPFQAHALLMSNYQNNDDEKENKARNKRSIRTDRDTNKRQLPNQQQQQQNFLYNPIPQNQIAPYQFQVPQNQAVPNQVPQQQLTVLNQPNQQQIVPNSVPQQQVVANSVPQQQVVANQVQQQAQNLGYLIPQGNLNVLQAQQLPQQGNQGFVVPQNGFQQGSVIWVQNGQQTPILINSVNSKTGNLNPTNGQQQMFIHHHQTNMQAAPLQIVVPATPPPAGDEPMIVLIPENKKNPKVLYGIYGFNPGPEQNKSPFTNNVATEPEDDSPTKQDT